MFVSLMHQVRKRVEETVTRLLKEIPGIRIAVFAHGDYQDKGHTYDTTWVNFSSDKKKICDFIKNVSSTCGYDSDECYELVLRQVRLYRLSLCNLEWLHRISKYFLLELKIFAKYLVSNYFQY